MNRLARLALETSVLEKFHCKMFLSVLGTPGANLFSSMGLEGFKRVKQLAFSLILATDMGSHYPVLERFKVIDVNQTDFIDDDDQKVSHIIIL